MSATTPLALNVATLKLEGLRLQRRGNYPPDCPETCSRLISQHITRLGRGPVFYDCLVLVPPDEAQTV